MIKLSQKKLIVKYLKNITDINGNYDRIRDGFAEYRYRLNREPEMTQEQLLVYATQ
mgnify:CR=1 FL=1